MKLYLGKYTSVASGPARSAGASRSSATSVPAHQPVAAGRSVTGGQASSSITRGKVTVRVSLDSASGVVGHPIKGTLTVVNHSGHPLFGNGVCPEYVYAIGLSNRRFPPDTFEPAIGCIPSFAFPTGTSTWPLDLSTTYASGPKPTPLPPGRYKATLITSFEHGFPIPPPITVTLRAGRTAAAGGIAAGSTSTTALPAASSTAP